MRTKNTALLSSLLILALAGCAAHRDPHRQHAAPGAPAGASTKHVLGPKTTCHGASCPVAVSVDANCNITAGDVDLKANHTPMVNIVWQLTGGVFQRPHGIFIKEGADRFTPGHGSGPVFTLQFRNHPKGDNFPYGVRVVVGGKPCPEFDPFIMN